MLVLRKFEILNLEETATIGLNSPENCSWPKPASHVSRPERSIDQEKRLISPASQIPNDDKNQCIPCAENEITPGCRDKCIACDIGKVPNDDKTECVGKCYFEFLPYF